MQVISILLVLLPFIWLHFPSQGLILVSGDTELFTQCSRICCSLKWSAGKCNFFVNICPIVFKPGKDLKSVLVHMTCNCIYKAIQLMHNAPNYVHMVNSEARKLEPALPRTRKQGHPFSSGFCAGYEAHDNRIVLQSVFFY